MFFQRHWKKESLLKIVNKKSIFCLQNFEFFFVFFYFLKTEKRRKYSVFCDIFFIIFLSLTFGTLNKFYKKPRTFLKHIFFLPIFSYFYFFIAYFILKVINIICF